MNPIPNTSPQTLFQMVGVPQPTFDWANATLVIIDAQQEYETGRLTLPDLPPTVATIERILTAARRRGAPVVHVLHQGGPGLFDPQAEGSRSIEALRPLEGERIIRKHLPDAFAGTELHGLLKQLGSERKLILVGFMTHMCITATALSALNLGYENFVVEDAVATRALRAANGKTISAADVNAAALAGLKDRVSWVIPSDELL